MPALRHHDVADTPAAQHRGRQQADGATTRHEHAIVGRDLREVDAVQRDRSRFGERGGTRRQIAGDAQEPGRRCGLEAAEGAPREVEQVGGFATQAYGRPAACARSAPTAARSRVDDDARADLPPVHLIADRGDGSGPFVAEHRARSRVALEHEVQVRAADAAVRNVEQHVVRTDRGNRKPLYLDRAVAHVDRGPHSSGNHAPSFAGCAGSVRGRCIVRP